MYWKIDDETNENGSLVRESKSPKDSLILEQESENSQTAEEVYFTDEQILHDVVTLPVTQLMGQDSDHFVSRASRLLTLLISLIGNFRRRTRADISFDQSVKQDYPLVLVKSEEVSI